VSWNQKWCRDLLIHVTAVLRTTKSTNAKHRNALPRTCGCAALTAVTAVGVQAVVEGQQDVG
jgi:hypothetical protein